MTIGIIDTNILIEFYRRRHDAVAWLQSQPNLADFGITSVNWLEFMEGASSKTIQAQSLSILHPFELLMLDETDQRWAMTQLQRYRLSHGVGYADCLIASIAYHLQVPFYTQNVKDFAPLPGTALVIKPY